MQEAVKSTCTCTEDILMHTRKVGGTLNFNVTQKGLGEAKAL